jgi:hypothetical protein
MPDVKEEKHGRHSKMLETPTPINVVETLEEEFKNQRGQFMVSRKSRLLLWIMPFPID